MTEGLNTPRSDDKWKKVLDENIQTRLSRNNVI